MSDNSQKECYWLCTIASSQVPSMGMFRVLFQFCRCLVPLTSLVLALYITERVVHISIEILNFSVLEASVSIDPPWGPRATQPTQLQGA